VGDYASVGRGTACGAGDDDLGAFRGLADTYPLTRIGQPPSW
jgi:hypothetical protein